jgi:hypothetical protein
VNRNPHNQPEQKSHSDRRVRLKKIQEHKRYDTR